jgi:hypothetical protein
MQSRKTAYILFAVAILAFPTPTPSQGNFSYEVCSNTCVEAAHKCLDQITADLDLTRADRIRVQCGESLDICLAACQNSAAAAFRKSHPK